MSPQPFHSHPAEDGNARPWQLWPRCPDPGAGRLRAVALLEPPCFVQDSSFGMAGFGPFASFGGCLICIDRLLLSSRMSCSIGVTVRYRLRPGRPRPLHEMQSHRILEMLAVLVKLTRDGTPECGHMPCRPGKPLPGRMLCQVCALSLHARPRWSQARGLQRSERRVSYIGGVQVY